MNDVLRELYAVVLSRKRTPEEGSYTCYLFREGLDKILKKCGEECAETIIAAKNLAAAEAAEAARARWEAPREAGECAVDPARTAAEARERTTRDPAQARAELENEICDLLYHLLVLMAQRDIPLEDIEGILRARGKKIGNLKRAHASDRDT
ncbi:MAG: phosphoribosyl-ATP diphosphatase [Clostridiales Family XIII bacterium]|jgi:phosphoribosyl-ATP pyrophosphohydrolase|nr:phosphoribosyl-ATP diphosphatase [Clostridiales Family XIII bacterium]